MTPRQIILLAGLFVLCGLLGIRPKETLVVLGLTAGTVGAIVGFVMLTSIMEINDWKGWKFWKRGM